MDKLIHLIYVSVSTNEFSQEALYELFSNASLKNQEHDITGLLLYVEGNFLQVLEGHEQDVLRLYKDIERDPRHTNSRKVLQAPIEERCFGNWGMGFAGVSAQEIQLIDGFSDFFTSNSTLHDLDEQRVGKVLQAFKEGRWREKIK